MITHINASIVLFGDNFSPAKAEAATGIRFTQKHEKGEIGIHGRFNGKPYPFGHAVIDARAEGDEDHLQTLLHAILPHMDSLRNSGVTHGKLQITYGYSEQCNLEFESQFLAKLANTGLQFTITCIQDSATRE